MSKDKPEDPSLFDIMQREAEALWRALDAIAEDLVNEGIKTKRRAEQQEQIDKFLRETWANP